MKRLSPIEVFVASVMYAVLRRDRRGRPLVFPPPSPRPENRFPRSLRSRSNVKTLVLHTIITVNNSPLSD